MDGTPLRPSGATSEPTLKLVQKVVVIAETLCNPQRTADVSPEYDLRQ